MRHQMTPRVLTVVWVVIGLGFVAGCVYVLMQILHASALPGEQQRLADFGEARTMLAFQYSTLIIIFVTLWSTVATVAIGFLQKRTIAQETT